MVEMQQMIATDYVNGYLFQLAKTAWRMPRSRGLWENPPRPRRPTT